VVVSCREIEASLIDLIDGRLDGADELRVHAHLESCEACRARTEAWGALTPAMRALAPPPPPELRARRMEVELARRLARAGAQTRSPRAARWIAAAAVFALAASSTAWWIARRGAGAFAEVARVSGAVTADGRPLDGALRSGARVIVPDGAALALALR